MFFSDYGMVSVRRIRSYENNLWGVRRGGPTEMAAGSGSMLYKAILFGMELSSMVMGVRFKAIIPQ